MSTTLQEDHVYLLPNGLHGQTYLIVQAQPGQDGWQLVECHATPLGSAAFKERAGLPQQQQFVYQVQPDGTLIQRSPSEEPTRFSMANLSLLGMVVGGSFVPIESQQASSQP